MTRPFNPPYEGATLEQLENENVQTLLHLHGYLRHEMEMLLRLIDGLIADGEVDEFEQSTVRSLISAGSQYAQHLHAHHHGETAMMFPVLERAGLDGEIVKRLNREHDELGALIDKVTAALFQLKTADMVQLTADLNQLRDALKAHLDYEEKHVCPLLTGWKSTSDFYRELFQRGF